MALRKTPEEKAERERQQAAIAAQQRREAESRKREAVRQAFFATPAGQARVAYDRGDHVFQYAFNVMAQKAIIVPMVGSNVAQQTADPSIILNSVCNEGWELVNGSFVFVETGQQSRDKFMASGQNVAVSGATIGYYLFKRSEGNRVLPLQEPWAEETAPRQMHPPAPPGVDPLLAIWEHRDEPATEQISETAVEATAAADDERPEAHSTVS